VSALSRMRHVRVRRTCPRPDRAVTQDCPCDFPPAGIIAVGYSSYRTPYGADKILKTVGSITAKMASWKLLLIQASLICSVGDVAARCVNRDRVCAPNADIPAPVGLLQHDPGEVRPFKHERCNLRNNPQHFPAKLWPAAVPMCC